MARVNAYQASCCFVFVLQQFTEVNAPCWVVVDLFVFVLRLSRALMAHAG